MIVTRSGRATGRVQGVMFRQTFVRALQKRALKGGASNARHRRDEVTFTAEGEAAAVEELIHKLGSRPLNSWGARVEAVEILDEVIPIERHEVTTVNVDDFAWSPGVEFYL
ncbi:MAG: acylphosphatase [Planctomycetota bacterium]|jgi:acylphosphatase